ncbi:MAG: hypothetical protein J07HB67_00963 [halophilic archaeon J07HB67]|jgi:hypothetical protein|nr:MAG: hypothetical protein J07HB67_00963 [halophilic archaeon J07HB67]
MSERMDELEELADSDLPGETDTDETTGHDAADVDQSAAESSDGGLRERLSPSGALFSPRRFLIALALTVGGLVVGGAVPLVGMVTRYVGLFAATFGYGLASGRSAYTEVGLAGAVAAAVTLLLGTLSTGGFVLGADLVGRYGVTLAGVGVGVGFLVALVGHYFGRDLRKGLTRDV